MIKKRNDYKKIGDYSIIGDLLTIALVGKHGSIDWLCLPHIDSPSIFARLLDHRKGGYFSIEPATRYTSKQNYIKHTNILETRFKTRSGYMTITDFMPVKHISKPYENTFPTIFRKVQCTKGHMDINIQFQPHFDYARAKTSLQKTDRGVTAKTKDENLYLETGLPFKIKSDTAESTIKLKQGDEHWLVLQYNDERQLTADQCNKALDTTLAYWNSWVNDCEVCSEESGIFKSPWREVIVRSGLVLKLLIQDLTGAICAAATTSLPEEIGGERNWDYRFNWIRDAAFTVRALYKLGYVSEARKNLEWFMQICTDNIDPKKIAVMYGMHGETDLREKKLKHLSGYRNSKPVRIGNGAAKQNQHDIYGELVNVFYETSRFGIDISERDWKLLIKLVNHVCNIWNTKDAGIWEVRSSPKHFVHSKLMCWVALDRAITIADKQKKDCPRKKWEQIREQIKDEIIKKGFNDKLNSFVQSYGSDIIDATSLLIPIYGFLPFNDPRVQGTLNAVLQKLTTKKGLVYRHEHRVDDGLKGKMGPFLLCSFWLVDVLAYSGRHDEAKRILLQVLDYASPTGLLSEMVDPKTGDLLGNYPQAYSHIGLINSTLFIEKARRKELGPLTENQIKTITSKLSNILKEERAKKRARSY